MNLFNTKIQTLQKASDVRAVYTDSSGLQVPASALPMPDHVTLMLYHLDPIYVSAALRVYIDTENMARAEAVRS